jgi:uncharacterized protein
MKRFLLTVISLCCLLLLPRAWGADRVLDDLRASGAIGERWDGLAVVRSVGADPAVGSLVDSVNAKRREIYAAQAKQQNAPQSEVGKVYAREIAAKAPRGTWFLGEDGKWVQKK